MEEMIFFAGFFWILALIALAATIWVIYDVFVNQKAMPDIEKVVWVLVALFLGWIGAIIYYFVVKASGKYERPPEEETPDELKVY
ncbi:hypothetical protein E3E23_05265 [Thermococcus sp. CX2]|uniref:PLDc N-terminal domain-containing protein n=1 Tax=Thermococcus sp. CX2 TaxID=163006 RepID=UPI00143A133F|nr:PLDc N-terminal domain-containing protein [Thermococcus sp. CX2]NJE85234.1 hypothetical protein [Thermococcus sp. CX2]